MRAYVPGTCRFAEQERGRALRVPARDEGGIARDAEVAGDGQRVVGEAVPGVGVAFGVGRVAVAVPAEVERPHVAPGRAPAARRRAPRPGRGSRWGGRATWPDRRPHQSCTASLPAGPSMVCEWGTAGHRRASSQSRYVARVSRHASDDRGMAAAGKRAFVARARRVRDRRARGRGGGRAGARAARLPDEQLRLAARARRAAGPAPGRAARLSRLRLLGEARHRLLAVRAGRRGRSVRTRARARRRRAGHARRRRLDRRRAPRARDRRRARLPRDAPRASPTARSTWTSCSSRRASSGCSRYPTPHSRRSRD